MKTYIKTVAVTHVVIGLGMLTLAVGAAEPYTIVLNILAAAANFALSTFLIRHVLPTL